MKETDINEESEEGEDEEKIRSFIAIDFPDNAIKEIARIQELVSKVKFTGKLTEMENLHLTLKFLGEIDEKKAEAVREKLREVKFEAFEAKLEEVGLFKHKGNPKIVWIKAGGKGVFELQKKIDEVLKDLFPKEERFMSHLTLARVRYVKDKKGFEKHISAIKTDGMKFEINEFKLKSSELRATGPVYRDIESFAASIE